MNVERDTINLIDRVVRRQLGDAVEAVHVAQDEDFDGDLVFHITVVFNSKTLDPQKTTGMVRHLRHELVEHQQSAFPIFAFVSKSEAARVAPEAA